MFAHFSAAALRLKAVLHVSMGLGCLIQPILRADVRSDSLYKMILILTTFQSHSPHYNTF